MAVRVRQERLDTGPALTLVTRKGCGLCEELREIIEAVAPEFGVRLEICDVDADAQLLSSFSGEVPVLLVNGRKAFKYRVTARQLRRRLSREARSRWVEVAKLLR